MAKRILDRDEFRAWLERRRTQVIGYACSSEDCPIAKYLNPTGLRFASITHASIYLKGKRRPLPQWARLFVNRIDLRLAGYR